MRCRKDVALPSALTPPSIGSYASVDLRRANDHARSSSLSCTTRHTLLPYSIAAPSTINDMLITRRPTQTTVSYTVSTRSPSGGLTSRLASYALLLLRVIAALLVATILLAEFRNTSIHIIYLGPEYTLAWAENVVLDTPVGLLAYVLIANSTWIWRAVICTGITWLILRKGYTEESLLVIRGLGVQTSTSSPSYLWTSSTRFIPTSSIQDIFIHEAFQGFETRFYLSIVVEGEEDVVVVFPVSVHLSHTGN